MSDNLTEYREQTLNELISFTTNTDSELDSILSTFGWTLESLENKDENYVLCPFNSGHRLPEKNLQQHIDACQWKQEGYNQFDIELSEPTLSSDNPYTIKLDADLQAQILLSAKQKNPKMLLESYEYNDCLGLTIDIYSALIKIGVGDRLIPRTSNRILADFTSDEREAIYDYVVANTKKIDIGQDIADLNKSKEKDEQKSISYLELLAQERNLKRRRAKHRGVHTNKKSHVEVMREVIEQQMDMFKEYLSEHNDIQDEQKETTQEVPDVSNSSKMTDADFKDTKFNPDQDANYYQKEKTNDRHFKEEIKREHRGYHYDRKDFHHNSYRKEKYRSNDEGYKSRERVKRGDRSKDRSKHRERSRDRRRSRSKDRHRNRSSERRESRHSDHRSRKRSRSKTRR